MTDFSERRKRFVFATTIKGGSFVYRWPSCYLVSLVQVWRHWH